MAVPPNLLPSHSEKTAERHEGGANRPSASRSTPPRPTPARPCTSMCPSFVRTRSLSQDRWPWSLTSISLVAM